MPDDTSGMSASRRQDLAGRYAGAGFETGKRLFGEAFLDVLSQHDSLDPEWTSAWLGYVYEFMYGRRVVDERTRALVMIGMHIAAGHYQDLRMHMISAIRLGTDPREILEVCLHAPLYVGMPTLRHSLGAFRAVLVELGLATLDEPPFQYLQTGQESE
jgi:3-oxoadipate enol-lactonase